jgi:DNA-directed RNA polymerase alpha subunit
MWYSVEIHNTPIDGAACPSFKEFLSTCSVRLRKALLSHTNPFDSWERLAAVTEADLRARPNCGVHTIEELREKMARYGLTLRTV